MGTQQIQLNAFQQQLLGVPEQFDLFLGGGRGGGKSYALALLALRHVEQYGAKARVLYLRKTFKGLADFELLTRELFGQVYGTAYRYNNADHVGRFPNGAYMELDQLETAADYQKYQGRSFTLLLVDEAAQWADPSLLDMLRSNLRGPKDIPIRVCLSANPGGVGHQWLAQRYVFQSGPWLPFKESASKRTWVYAPSTFAGNDLIDREQYADSLTASCPEDAELLRAWVDGDWTVAKGAFFADCMSEERNAIAPWDSLPDEYDGWDYWIAHDFGSAAPSVTYLLAKSPGASHQGLYFPRNSIVALDELAAHCKGNLNQGLNWNAIQTAEAIRELCAKWKLPATGVGDDAMFAHIGSANGSIAHEFASAGVYLRPAQKGGRVAGWARMRTLLANAGKPDRPGLYISRSASYWWATAPTIPRDSRKMEDIDTTAADHGCDAMRYGLLHESIAYDVQVRF